MTHDTLYIQLEKVAISDALPLEAASRSGL